MTPIINYKRLGKASQHYENLNYRYVEAPWFASLEASRLTLPPDRELWYVKKGGDVVEEPLVGSAEQSLLDMVLRGELTPGSYQTITPCWRDEEVDDLHREYFMKLELMTLLEADATKEKKERELQFMVWDACRFLGRFLEIKEVEQGDGSIDIVSKRKGYELGSYGIREYRGHSWVYGTGLAEPRLSSVIEMIR